MQTLNVISISDTKTRLRKIWKPYIKQKDIKSNKKKEMFFLMEKAKTKRYSVLELIHTRLTYIYMGV